MVSGGTKMPTFDVLVRITLDYPCHQLVAESADDAERIAKELAEKDLGQGMVAEGGKETKVV
jgi:hypothetical protein